jgi:DNA-binding winged helix-turn-helix (wHTH) protein/TolB-like protein
LETTNGNKNGALTNGHRYAFDNFEIDPANRVLLRGGEAVPLTGKVFDVLLVFVENPGRLLEKDELLEKVWHSDFVEEGNLARNVSTLRKILGDTGKEQKYIVTVQGHGYRFLPDVSKIGPGQPDIEKEAKALPQIENVPITSESSHASRRWILAIVAGAVLLSAGWLGTERFFTSPNRVKSLAILPLRSLNADDNYLGIGIADAVIRKISQSHQLTVRPTSAVLRYVKEDRDALAAAGELNTDAVLEGTVQRSAQRLRISVNLLRSADGVSLWADNFDMPEADIFAIQDKVAQQVSARLQLHLDTVQQAETNYKYPANPTAYEFYIKGIFSLDQRGYGDEAMPQMQATIDFFKRSTEADPNYALAHAQLGWAYVWTAQFIEPAEPKWVDLARQEIKRADEIDLQIAETHLAKAMLFWSKYENFQNDAAIRELLVAQRLNPNTSHGELAGILGHLGLEEQATRELNRALEIDPTSQSLKDLLIILPYLRGDPDAWIVERQKAQSGRAHFDPWYYLRKSQLDDAKKAIDERLPEGSKYPDFMMIQALYNALKGDFHAAESKVPGIIEMVPLNDQSRHHITYNAACIYALAGNSSDAVKWLRETAATGFSNYPLFARDPFLDRIRQTSEFAQFMTEQKEQHDRFRQEFGDS